MTYEQRLAEEERQRYIRNAPTPGPPLGEPPVALDPRFPPQVIANLSPPVRTAGGELPAVDASLSEADRIRDPAARMARLEAEVAGLKRENSELKQRVAKLEEIQRRSLGAAYETEGEVYR